MIDSSCVLIQVDNLWGEIKTVLPPQVTREIDLELSYYPEGYEHSAKFKQKKWDGRIRLYTGYTRRFPAGLLYKVRQILESHHLPYRVSENYPSLSDSESLEWNSKWQLRPYQQTIVDTVLNHKRGIIKLATGGGKTLCAGRIMYETGLPALFLVDSTDLALQTRDALRKYLPSADIGIIGDDRDERGQITIGIIQALAHRTGLVDLTVKDKLGNTILDRNGKPLKQAKDPDPDLMRWLLTRELSIYDEVHGLAADRGTRFMRFLRNCRYRVGLSATPLERGDRANLLTISQTGEILLTITSSELINMGYLAKPTIFVINFSCRVKKSLKYGEVYNKAIATCVPRNQLIARLIKDRELNRPKAAVLAVVVQIPHGKALQEECRNAGFDAVFIHGQMPSEHRKKVLDNFRAGKIPVLIGSTILNKGIDLPNLTAFINAGGMADRIQTQQKLGRALHVDAPTVRVYDILDYSHEYLAAHSLERLNVYQSEPAYQLFTLPQYHMAA